jgi:hypothetical protein
MTFICFLSKIQSRFACFPRLPQPHSEGKAISLDAQQIIGDKTVAKATSSKPVWTRCFLNLAFLDKFRGGDGLFDARVIASAVTKNKGNMDISRADDKSFCIF